MEKRALENPRIVPVWNSAVSEVLGNDKDGVTGIKLSSTVGAEGKSLDIVGLFVAIGHTPNTDFLKGVLDLDSKGYILWKKGHRSDTSIEGVFAAGDVAVQDLGAQQAASALGDESALAGEPGDTATPTRKLTQALALARQAAKVEGPQRKQLAAEALAPALEAGRAQDELMAYPEAFEKSWLNEELQQTRNFKLWFKKGKTAGQLMTGIEQWLLPKLGVTTPPWTLHNHKADHTALRPASECKPIAYPKPDGKLTFDRLSSVFISNTNHEENQPIHLTLKDAAVPVEVNLARYAGPENRYCPAGVYEFVSEGGASRLQINAQNCVHCKTCDIKDPTQNIVWVTPQGGEGPNYPNM